MLSLNDRAVGANAGRTRNHNRQIVLGRVRAAGRVGRAEIARATGLSTQAVSNIIADLMADGLIREEGRRAAGRGLPAVQYALEPTGGYAVGVEIRPDAVFAMALDLCGRPLASTRRPLSAADRASVTETVRLVRRAVEAEAGLAPARVLGAGIVMPGPLGATGIRGTDSDLSIWEGLAPDAWFEEALDLPVVIENDANAAAIAERMSGAAQGLDDFAFLYFGSGLGLGVVSGGRLIEGAFGNAGEIGHVPVPGATGIVPLESAVSRLSVQRALAAEGVRIESGADLARLYRAGCPALLRWLDDAVAPLSAAVTIVENLFDPEAVILGGAMPDELLDHLTQAVRLPDRSVANRADREGPRLRRGASGRMTATLGAAALILHKAFTPRIAA